MDAWGNRKATWKEWASGKKGRIKNMGKYNEEIISCRRMRSKLKCGEISYNALKPADCASLRHPPSL
jgi:hypothetical protein